MIKLMNADQEMAEILHRATNEEIEVIARALVSSAGGITFEDDVDIRFIATLTSGYSNFINGARLHDLIAFETERREKDKNQKILERTVKAAELSAKYTKSITWATWVTAIATIIGVFIGIATYRVVSKENIELEKSRDAKPTQTQIDQR